MRNFEACVFGIQSTNESGGIHRHTHNGLHQVFVCEGADVGSPCVVLRCVFHGSEMVALWALADVALVTSLREGVNLGAMEFVACQQTSMHGVLVYR